MTRRLFRSALPALLLSLMPLLSAAPVRADTWVFDKQNTHVSFTWDHAGLSRQSGQFLDVDGRLEFTPTDPEGGAVEVAIKTASLTTGVKEFDTNLKSPDFFDAARNPIITFQSTAVRRTGDKTGDVDGDLTIAGVTRPVTLRVVWNFTGEHPFAVFNPTYKGKWVSGFSASGTIKRSDWGLKRAIPIISDEIGITIEAEFLLKE
jgi:polyisoprenoid-binding protein YceI